MHVCHYSICLLDCLKHLKAKYFKCNLWALCQSGILPNFSLRLRGWQRSGVGRDASKVVPRQQLFPRRWPEQSLVFRAAAGKPVVLFRALSYTAGTKGVCCVKAEARLILSSGSVHTEPPFDDAFLCSKMTRSCVFRVFGDTFAICMIFFLTIGAWQTCLWTG